MYKRGSMSHSRVVPFACVCDGRADSLSREIIKGLLFALVSGKRTLLVSNETAGTSMGAGTLSTFLSFESAPGLSVIILPEKKHLLLTTAQLTLLGEKFSSRTSSFFGNAGSSLWFLMVFHRIPPQKLTREVLRDGQSRSLVVSVFNPVIQKRRLDS